MANVDIAFIGNGYAVATYLAFVDLREDARVLIVGSISPWMELATRGRGFGIVNHPTSMYLWDQEKRTMAPDPTWESKRSKLQTPVYDLLGSEHSEIFEGLTVWTSSIGKRKYMRSLRAVTKIVKYQTEGETGFEITIGSSTLRATKVVYGGGAGPHRFPTEFIDKKFATSPGLFDLDGFMREYGSKEAPGNANADQKRGLKGKTIGLVGPNAGLDALIAILDSGGAPVWFIKDSEKPFWLASKHNRASTTEGKVVEGDALIQYVEEKHTTKFKTLKIEGIEEGFKATYTDPKSQQQTTTIDYFVYAMGQDPTATNAFGPGPLAVLDAAIVNDLQPIKDINQRFSSGEVVVGLQTSNATRSSPTSVGVGLEVIGASAFAIANTLGRGAKDKLSAFGTFAGRAAAIKDAMAKLPKLLNQQTLVAADQLGVIRAQIEALTGYDPRARFGAKPRALLQADSDIYARLSKYVIGDRSQVGAVVDAVVGAAPEDLRTGLTLKLVAESLARKNSLRPELFSTPLRWADDARLVVKLLHEVAATVEGYAPRIDFNGADRTAMFVEIVTYHPTLDGAAIEQFVDEVLRLRGERPRGFDQSQLDRLHQVLAARFDWGKLL